MFLIIISIILFLTAVFSFLISKRLAKNAKKLKEEHNIPDGKIIYSDLNKPERALFSKKYRIAGKPDYILNREDHLIPVEVKTGVHFTPQKSHIMQLMAYCHLLEENYGDFVPYGILVYSDTSREFKIPFDPEMRFDLESSINAMRSMLRDNEIYRNHAEINRCKKCSMRSYCEMKLI